jgi:preprotein translocase subunit SecA
MYGDPSRPMPGGVVHPGGTPERFRRNVPVRSRPERHVGRNDACPCGSGKKYKRCHLGAGVSS